MDKFITGINGIMPLFHEDIAFMMETMAAAANGLSAVYGDNVILNGAVATDNGDGSYTVTKGWAVINGELVYVPAQTVADVTGGIYWSVVETEDPDSEREFEIEHEGVKIHKVWARRRAIATAVSSEDTVELSMNIADNMQQMKVERAEISSFGTSNLSVDFSDCYMYCEQYGRMVVVHGRLRVSTNTETSISVTDALPAPQGDVAFSVSVLSDDESSQFASGDVDDTGVMTFKPVESAGYITFNFSYIAAE